MRNKNKLERFAYNCDRPFTAREASELCNVSFKRTQMFLKELRDEGKIRIQRIVRNKKYYYIWNIKAKKKSNSKKREKRINVMKMVRKHEEIKDFLSAHKANYA